jgi:uncharacterized SAM-binding protein YcdF (DUF218 family)
VAALVLAAAWAVDLARFAANLPVPGATQPTSAEAAVVLTGGSRRLEAGLRLLKDGRIGALFISGVDSRVGREPIAERISEAEVALPDSMMACCVDLGYRASDTAGNAIETADWMRAGGWRSLLLVTSGYHMPRSLTEFRHALPGVEIHPLPVFSEEVRLAEWWFWPGTFALVAQEHFKLRLAGLRHGLGDLVTESDQIE